MPSGDGNNQDSPMTRFPVGLEMAVSYPDFAVSLVLQSAE
jgi:hypothetical protein